MATQGTATIDFGATAATRASVVVTGQASILGTSFVEAFLMADSTTDNDTEAHILGNALMRLVVGDRVPGTGFTIYAVCEPGATGQFQVRWVWV